MRPRIPPHPFGPAVAQQVHARKLRDELIPELARRAREDLARCTGEVGCPSSVHRPDCRSAS